jgi:hypothetical protein
VTADGPEKIDKASQRVEFVKTADRLVVFDDQSKKIEHLMNLAGANDKELTRFKEV